MKLTIDRAVKIRATLAAMSVVMTTNVGVIPVGAAAPSGWRLAYCSAPPGPAGGQMVYDAASRQLVAALGNGSGSLVNSDGGRCWTTPSGTLLPARRQASIVYDPAIRQVIVFGGWNSSTSGFMADTWTWNGKAWNQYGGTGPSARAEATIVYDAATSQVVLFGGIGSSDATNGTINEKVLADTWIWDPQHRSWTQAAGGPPARYDASMVYDAATRQVVLVGGHVFSGDNQVLSDTWTWDGHRWTKQTKTELPARFNAAMEYDAASREVVLFGGQSSGFGATAKYLSDTWTWNGKRWRQGPAGPPPRAHASMAYDPASRQVVMYGGMNINQGLADTWIWAGGRWRSYRGPVPPARTDGAIAFNEAKKRLVLFGGVGSTYPANVSGQRDAWSWDGRQWTLETAPLISKYFTALFDPATRQVVLHGPSVSNFASDDTYLWNGRRWSHLDGVEPPNRNGFSMVYDAARRQIVLFGGFDDNTLGPSPAARFRNDTWTFNGHRWQRHVGPSPTPRVRATLVYDAATRQVVMFGGSNFDNAIPSSGGPLDDTWTWDGTRWTPHPAGPHPSARTNASAVYDAAHRQVVVFGGYGPPASAPQQAVGTYVNDDVYLGDTWTWTGTAWKQATGTSPSPRRDAQMVFDAATKRVLLTGGVGPNNAALQELPLGVADPTLIPDPDNCGCPYAATFLGDAWTWDGTRWAQQTTTVPTARAFAATAYDDVHHRVLMFGGQHNSAAGLFTTGVSVGMSYDAKGPLNDTWTFANGWARHSGGPAPAARWRPAMVWDPGRRQMVLVGGYDGQDAMTDTWVWTG